MVLNPIYLDASAAARFHGLWGVWAGPLGFTPQALC